MKKLYLGSNLKMYKNSGETAKYLEELAAFTKAISRDELELFIIPSYTSLAAAVEAVERSAIRIGAQNMCWEEQGQFTGEISVLMLKEMGLDLVMIGHSERRHVFGETDQEENKKVRMALKHGLTALLCVGETAEEKDYGIGTEILRKQLLAGLHGVDGRFISQVWIAYEPVWSIGVGGTPAPADYAQRMHQAIQACLVQIFGEEGNQIPILYGGSVNMQNAEELICQPAVDGLFVGRSAWQADDFYQLIQNVRRAYGKRA